jgi:hypothetical protein
VVSADACMDQTGEPGQKQPDLATSIFTCQAASGIALCSKSDYLSAREALAHRYPISLHGGEPGSAIRIRSGGSLSGRAGTARVHLEEGHGGKLGFVVNKQAHNAVQHLVRLIGLDSDSATPKDMDCVNVWLECIGLICLRCIRSFGVQKNVFNCR